MKKVLVYQKARIDYLGGTFAQFISRLKEEFDDAVPEEYRTTAKLDLTTRYGDDYSDKEYATIDITWYRPETPEEAAARIKLEEVAAQHRREQYEQLKREFGE